MKKIIFRNMTIIEENINSHEKEQVIGYKEWMKKKKKIRRKQKKSRWNGVYGACMSLVTENNKVCILLECTKRK